MSNALNSRHHHILHTKTWKSTESVLLNLFLEGIRLGESVLYVGNRFPEMEVLENLGATTAQRDELGRAAHEGQLQIIANSNIYAENRYFNPQKTLADFGKLATDSFSKGYSRFRALGEVQFIESCINPDKSALLKEYELAISDVLKKLPITAFCVYCEESVSQTYCFEHLHTHPTLISPTARGGDKYIANPLYLSDDRDLESLVKNSSAWIDYICGQGYSWLSKVSLNTREAMRQSLVEKLFSAFEKNGFQDVRIPNLILKTNEMVTSG